MKSTIVLFTIIYVASLAGGGYVYLKNKTTASAAVAEVVTTKTALASVQSNLEAEQLRTKDFEKKIADANAHAKFLALALCPTLEATDKNALCIKDNTEWFSETMQAGTMLTDPDTKTKMDALLVALGAKNKPTSKQLYEMLKPIEIDSIKALGENLK